VYGWNPVKARENRRKHGVSFEAAADFEWDTATIYLDDDLDYGEERWVATGFIGSSIFVLVYTERPDQVWIISLRRATRQEIRRYEEDYRRGR
jgi:uncharacterized DUF497 family protein